MALFGFEKDTLLDLTVNFIPLGIILFFIAAFAVVPAFGVDPVFTGMQFALMVAMFLLLGVLTYYAGRAIENAEKAEAAAALDEPAEDDPALEESTDEPPRVDDESDPALEQSDDA
nr:DUF6684 family protein [Halomicroarcula sp. ZS-22-S1]